MAVLSALCCQTPMVLAGWRLQQSKSVTARAVWSASTGVTTSGGTNYLTLIRPTGRLFFRLHNP